MSHWKYAVSWSKFVLALECPRKLQHTVDKKPSPGDRDTTFYMDLGTMVQFIFEQYYNQQINMKAGGREEKVIQAVTDKILASTYLEKLQTTYPHNLDEDELRKRIRAHTLKGFRIMNKMGMTKYKFRSEVKWSSVFRGFRMFCMIDFLREGRSGVYLFDGKGHGQMNADPRQVLYYALAVAASGHKIAGGGLIYWQHKYQPVDLSPAAIKHFIDTDFKQGRPYFEALQKGTQEVFETTPSKKICGRCRWKHVCEDSAVKLPAMRTDLPDVVGLGEL